MLHLDLTRELDRLRIACATAPKSVLPCICNSDTSKGMAAIFEDTPASLPVGVFTASFAERFCRETPGYVWRKL